MHTENPDTQTLDSTPVSQSETILNQMDLDDVRFLPPGKRYLAPINAMLVISGEHKEHSGINETIERILLAKGFVINSEVSPTTTALLAGETPDRSQIANAVRWAVPIIPLEDFSGLVMADYVAELT